MYVYRGYTTDEAYAIYLQFPVDAPILFSAEAAFDPDANTNPQAIAAPTASPDDQKGVIFAGYNLVAYNQEVSWQLNLLSPEDFTPNLKILDALVESLKISAYDSWFNRHICFQLAQF